MTEDTTQLQSVEENSIHLNTGITQVIMHSTSQHSNVIRSKACETLTVGDLVRNPLCDERLITKVVLPP